MTMLTTIVDLQFGSTGKGLIAGYLSERKPYDVVVSANMPNAGHTFVDNQDRKWINKVLPSGLYSPSLKVVGIGPGAVFDPRRLALEIDQMRERIRTDPVIMIHENAALLDPRHAELERKLNPIASTMQGSAEAMMEKIRRNPMMNNTAGFNVQMLDEILTGRGESLASFVRRAEDWNIVMINAESILCEGSQGYSLGLNAGFYPFCTSRDCTVSRLLADCSIPRITNMRVIGTARTFPIRVGNTEGGHSGPCYPDQVELTWEALGVEPETTTVTGRIRRVFTFSDIQIREAIMMNGVDEVFLNFCNYDPQEAIRIVNRINEFGKHALGYRGMGAWEGEIPQMVKYMGFGPRSSQILEYSGYTP